MCEYKYTHTYISIVIFSPPSVSIYIKLEKNIYMQMHIYFELSCMSKIKKSYNLLLYVI